MEEDFSRSRGELKWRDECSPEADECGKDLYCRKDTKKCALKKVKKFVKNVKKRFGDRSEEEDSRGLLEEASRVLEGEGSRGLEFADDCSPEADECGKGLYCHRYTKRCAFKKVNKRFGGRVEEEDSRGLLEEASRVLEEGSRGLEFA